MEQCSTGGSRGKRVVIKARGLLFLFPLVGLQQYLEKKSLSVVGKGTQTRSFVHVSDVINAILVA